MAHFLASCIYSRIILSPATVFCRLIHGYHPRQTSQFNTSASARQRSIARKMDSFSGLSKTRSSSKRVLRAIGSGGSGIPVLNIPIWARLVLAFVFCLGLAPFYQKILRIEGEVEKDAETVAEVVEAVAKVTEKIAADIADAIPGDGRIKQMVLEVEHIAEEVVKDADKAEALIQKNSRSDTSASDGQISITRKMDPFSGISKSPSSNKGVPRANTGSGGSGIPIPNIPIWAMLVSAFVFCLALTPSLKIEGEVKKDVETIAESVEAVAKVTEKIAADIADAIPEDGKIKQMVLEVEHIAEEVVKDADKAEALIQKIDELKEENEQETEQLEEPQAKKAKLTEKELLDTDDIKQSKDPLGTPRR